MTVRAVVFDIGGVLEYTPSLGVSQTWEEILGLQPGELDRRLHDVWRGGTLGLISLREVHRGIAGILGIDAARVDKLMADVWTEYLGRPNTELVAYLRGLRPRYRTGLLSNSFVGAREREQAAYGFADLVDVVVYSHEVGVAKPDPRMYALVCERLGVTPPETVFLDDVPESVDGARRVGMRAVLFTDNTQAIGEIDGILGR
jgi:epoxide hydrolase-like predicted phosphatase